METPVDRIAQLFEESGQTAKSILSQLELSTSALSEWKKGKAKPSADAIIKLSAFFNVSTDYLLTGKETVPASYEDTRDFEVLEAPIIERVFLLLEEKHLKAADLCRYIRISTSNMTNWKKRGTDPPAKLIPPICEFLGVSCEYLLTGQESSFKPVSSEYTEWISLIQKLPKEAQLEFKGELKGYIRHMEESVAAEERQGKSLA